ncbi:MAG: methylated-DNA--[protein]-cysteine S-methyltransferase [Anaerolineales bacterium]|nr:methylated-DNA--[protein]-cysteine S-methyltransferase [Anaerolineales bacterium]
MLSISQIPNTPLGPVNVAWTEKGVLAVEIGGDLEVFAAQIGQRLGSVPMREDIGAPRTQVEEYLLGKRTTFELEIDWALCTPFQRQVLELQLAIPFGETRTYGQLAAQLGQPRAARAVGRAGATNPIPLIIPCHRVLGSDGSLRGYGAPGGVKTKAWLLALERQQ